MKNEMAIMPSEYLLSRNVYFCGIRDHFVFLDLKNDEYSCINSEKSAVFASFVEGKPLDSQANSSTVDGQGPYAVLAQLAASGILTTDEEMGKAVKPILQQPPVDLLFEPDDEQKVRIRPSHMWSFFIACTTASARLRWSTIEKTVKVIERRKNHSGKASRTLDLEKARRLVRTFIQLRSLFPANYLCLFDSLALVEFLARHGVFPTWVFGVQVEPWAAHCWVQQGSILFNDDIEEVSVYTPILAV